MPYKRRRLTQDWNINSRLIHYSDLASHAMLPLRGIKSELESVKVLKRNRKKLNLTKYVEPDIFYRLLKNFDGLKSQ